MPHRRKAKNGGFSRVFTVYWQFFCASIRAIVRLALTTSVST
jgi:hypothetical protein